MPIGAPDVIRSFDKIRNHFGVNRIAQAGALAALADQPYLRETVGRIAAAREEIARIAAANGLEALPSATNFVTIDCGQDGAFARGACFSNSSPPTCSCGCRVLPRSTAASASAPAAPADLAVLAEALPKALAAARG